MEMEWVVETVGTAVTKISTKRTLMAGTGPAATITSRQATQMADWWPANTTGGRLATKVCRKPSFVPKQGTERTGFKGLKR